MVEIIDKTKYTEVIKQNNVLIVLGSALCKDCLRIEPFLEELQTEFVNQIQIYKIDSRNEEDLSAALHIRAIPTLICYSNGVEVGERLIEPRDKDAMTQQIRQSFGI